MTIEDVNQEPIPAVSICIPTSLKWPGVIKSMSRTYPQIKQDLSQPIHDQWYKAISTYITDKRQGLSIYDSIEKLFQADDHKKDFIKWLLNVIFNIKDEESKLDEIGPPFWQSFHAALLFNHLDLLSPTNIQMMKSWICDWNNDSFCENITKESIETTFNNCKDMTLSFCSLNQNDLIIGINETIIAPQKFTFFLNNLWGFDKYWRSEKILEYYIYHAYNKPNISFATMSETLTANSYLTSLNTMYSSKINDELSPFYLWHFLFGMPLSEHGDKFATYLKGIISNPTQTTTTEMDKKATACLRGSDLNSQPCQDVNDFIQQFNQSTIKLFETWMDQPKIHGDENQDYVLVPLCSFGDDPLEKCNEAFKSASLKGQDRKCFTYEEKRQVNVGPSNGFNFLLNLKNIPHDKREPLFVDLYLHEPGSYPDLFKVKTFPISILPDEEVIKVGISMTNRKSTESFEAMSMEKRNCILSSDQKKYNRVNCVVDTIHKIAAERCGCIPRNMGSQLLPICDLYGAICFRNETRMSKENFNQSICSLECNGRYYSADKTVENYQDMVTYGQEFIDFLWNNPTQDLIQKDVGAYSGTTWTHSSQFDAEHIGKSYSLVQVYFKHPMKTVITQDAKITLAGMISNIGGTLGIFLGVSMINVFDYCFGVFMFIKRLADKNFFE